VRYVDFMDNFLAQSETCHTADNFGVALTAAEYAGGSGRDLMLGVALAYTVQSRFVDHANFMSRGFDHTAQLAFSLGAAAGPANRSGRGDQGCRAFARKHPGQGPDETARSSQGQLRDQVMPSSVIDSVIFRDIFGNPGNARRLVGREPDAARKLDIGIFGADPQAGRGRSEEATILREFIRNIHVVCGLIF